MPYGPIAVLLAALCAVLPSASAQEPKPGPCERLGRVHTVSFKGHEADLFAAAVAIGSESTRTPFDAPAVLTIYAACLESLKASDDPHNAAVAASLRGLRVLPGESGNPSYTQAAGGPAVALPANQGGVRLAKTLVGRALHELDLPKKERAAASNALWFLWFESYVRSLHNRYDAYRYADELAADAAVRLGKRYAIGVRTVRRDGRVDVEEVFDDKLAAAGFVAGAEILTIDDRPVETLSASDAERYGLNLRPFAYRVTGRHEGRSIQASAQAVPRRFETVWWTSHGDLGYLRIERFAVESIIELRRALRAIERAGLRGVVVDVRSNPGGVASPRLIDCFLKPGQTTMSFRESDSGKEVDIDATVEYHGLPLVVLVDDETASMAETFAAAMQVHKRGPVVGTRTFGKGVGQTIHEVLDEGTFHLVERTYFYPGTRNSWDAAGITPDVVVELTPDDAARVRKALDNRLRRIDDPASADSVLDKGFELLRGQP